MKEAIRAVSTAGIYEGCLHWINVLEEQKCKRLQVVSDGRYQDSGDGVIFSRALMIRP